MTEERLKEIQNTSYTSIEHELLTYVEHLRAERDRYREALVEVKKDIETNATDTLWSHDCVAMTAVERIEWALEPKE